MSCLNRFCIYYRNEFCAKGSNTFDAVGRCQECVWLEIDEKILDRLRKEQTAKRNIQLSRRLFRRGEMRKVARLRDAVEELTEKLKKDQENL